MQSGRSRRAARGVEDQRVPGFLEQVAHPGGASAHRNLANCPVGTTRPRPSAIGRPMSLLRCRRRRIRARWRRCGRSTTPKTSTRPRSRSRPSRSTSAPSTPKAVAKIVDNADVLLESYKYPAEHWGTSPGSTAGCRAGTHWSGRQIDGRPERWKNHPRPR